jgi:hypothetical protein
MIRMEALVYIYIYIGCSGKDGLAHACEESFALVAIPAGGCNPLRLAVVLGCFALSVFLLQLK